ncbi:MAG: HAD family hydrolase, partial [Spirochaetota bacterium]
ETLYVGNSYAYDVVGAARAGMKTAWLNDRGRRHTASEQANGSDEAITPDFTFGNYSELRDWLMPRLAS